MSAIAFACLCLSPAESPISTDRPGFLFSPLLVSPHRWQIESGVPTYARSKGSEASRTWSAPIAIRYGFSEGIELRASLPAWTDAASDSTSAVDGFSDVEIGIKLGFNRSGEDPLALLMSMRLPTGSEEFSGDLIGASGYVIGSTALSDQWSVTGMLGSSYAPVKDGAEAWSGTLAALVSTPCSEDTSAYAELVLLPGFVDAAGQSYAGAGWTWTVNHNTQFDLSFDVGLDDDSAAVIASVGFSCRL